MANKTTTATSGPRIVRPVVPTKRSLKTRVEEESSYDSEPIRPVRKRRVPVSSSDDDDYDDEINDEELKELEELSSSINTTVDDSEDEDEFEDEESILGPVDWDV